MKKKLMVSVVLMLCLCLGCVSALAVKGNVTLFGGSKTEVYESVQSIAAIGDTLYAGTYNGVYTWTPDQEAAVMFDESMSIDQSYWGDVDDMDADMVESQKKSFSKLVSDGDQLYGLNTIFGIVAPLNVTAEGLVPGEAVQLDWETLAYYEGEYSSMRQIYGAVIQDGALFLLTQVSDYDWNNNILYRYDLASGARTIVITTCIRNIATYKDGKLLGMLYDRENSEQNDVPTLVTVDELTGTIETVQEYPASQASGLVYNQGSDTAYILGQGEVFASVAGAPFEVVAYLPCDYPSNDMPVAMLASGYYAVQADYDTVTVRNVDPALKPDRVLRISGSYADDVTNAFMAANPEIPVVFASGNYYSAESITQSMVSGANDVDIFGIYSSGGFANLRDKGYCYELGQSQILTDAIQAMYPQFTQDLQRDGKIFAFPKNMYGSTLAYAPSVLEAIGLTTDDLPKNFSEMVDFAVDWVEIYGEENPEFTLFQYVYNIRQQLFSQAVQEYIGYYQMIGEELSFDTPLFHKLLGKIEEATPILSELNPEDEVNGFGWGSDDLPTSLFWWDYSFIPEDYAMRGYELSLLPLDEGIAPVLMGQMQMFTINPNSPNVDLAIEFLEYYAQNMPQGMKLVLYPDENEPIENSYYQQSLDYYTGDIANLEKQLAELKEEDAELRKSLEEQLGWMQEALVYMENDRWAVSAEQIEVYRGIAQYVTVPMDNAVFSGDSPEVNKLLTRYLDGELDSTRFIKEFDRIIQMINMENR